MVVTNQQKKKQQKKKEPLKLDQMMSVLFRLSRRLQLQLINGLFGESFSPADVKMIHYGNAKFDSDEYDRIIGDLFMKLDTVRGTFPACGCRTGRRRCIPCRC